jgi:hypothetical protein
MGIGAIISGQKISYRDITFKNALREFYEVSPAQPSHLVIIIMN